MEYVVIRTCYFAGRLFERGEIAIFGAEHGNIPDHFKAVKAETVHEAEAKPAPAKKKAAPKKKA